MRLVRALAAIRLNVVSVEQFLSIASGLADEIQSAEIGAQVYESAREARAAAALIEHLRNLFSHQLCVENESSSIVSGQDHWPISRDDERQSEGAANSSLLRVDNDDNEQARNVHDKRHYKKQQLNDSSTRDFFAASNKQTLVRAARSLVANVAKIFYLIDSFAFQQQQQQPQHSSQLAAQVNSSSSNNNSNNNNSRQGKQLDNAAGYSQLVRSLGELSSELVDLGQCLLVANHKHTPKAYLKQQQQQQQHENLHPSIPMFPGYEGRIPEADAQQLANQIQDMQSLFQVNRLIIDRSILLLLSGSKCSLRQGEERLRGLETRQAVVVQIRAALSIIMALVKCSIFGLPMEALSSGASNSSSAGNEQFQVPGARGKRASGLQLNWKLPEKEEASGAQQQQQRPRQSQIMNYFLEASGSVHEAINKLQLQLAPLAQAPNYKCLVEALDLSLANLQEQSDVELCATEAHSDFRDHNNQTAWPSSVNTNYPVDKENQHHHQYHPQVDNFNEFTCSALPADGRQDKHLFSLTQNQVYLRPPSLIEKLQEKAGSRHEDASERIQSQLFVLLRPRQLLSALNKLFLTDLCSTITERAHEFTDCAYTKHEHRETLLLLLSCLKLQLNKLVRLIYRLKKRKTGLHHQQVAPSCNGEVGGVEQSLCQIRQLAAQLEETCAELKYELQSVVIELSDELDRCNGQPDLIRQLKQLCILGEPAKCSLMCTYFQEQAERLLELCRMFKQVSPTHKMRIMSKTLAHWFHLNLPVLLRNAQSLSESPRSRPLKELTWAQAQAWCSFYDDFCQLARQLAYLTHAQYDAYRAQRVAAVRERLLSGVDEAGGRGQNTDRLEFAPAAQQQHLDLELSSLDGDDGRSSSSSGNPYYRHLHPSLDYQQAAQVSLIGDQQHQSRLLLNDTTSILLSREDPRGARNCTALTRQEQARAGAYSGRVPHAASVQSLQGGGEASCCGPYSCGGGGPSGLNDSPRSLDHYYGFGAHYQQQRRAAAMNHPPPPTSDRYCPCYESTLPVADSKAGQQEPDTPSPLHWPWPEQAMSPQPYVPAPQHLSQQHQHIHEQQRQQVPFDDTCIQAPEPPRRTVTIEEPPRRSINRRGVSHLSEIRPRQQQHHQQQQQRRVKLQDPKAAELTRRAYGGRLEDGDDDVNDGDDDGAEAGEEDEEIGKGSSKKVGAADQQSSSTTEPDKWSDSDADAIVRGARETAQMALSMYQFTRGEGDLNTTQDLFTQAELFAEEANELYKEVRCFSYKVPAGDLKKELLSQLGAIPALVQQLQFIVKNPTVGKPATFAKVDSVIRETRSLMEAVNRVVTATLSCRQHYNMAIASMRKRTRTLSPSYRADKGNFEFDSQHSGGGGAFSNRQSSSGAGDGIGSSMSGRQQSGGSMGSEPDI